MSVPLLERMRLANLAAAEALRLVILSLFRVLIFSNGNRTAV